MTILKSFYKATLISSIILNSSFAQDLTAGSKQSDINNINIPLTVDKPLNTTQLNNEEPLLDFSENIVKDTAKITQLTIIDKQQLKIAGVEEKDIFKFVYQFEEHSKNIFFLNTIPNGKFIYGIIIKPSPESAKKRAKQLKLNPDDSNVIDKICREEPTQCSITSISNFQNGSVPKELMAQFEKDMFSNSNEIFWYNYKNPGEIKFFFEVSLKNSL